MAQIHASNFTLALRNAPGAGVSLLAQRAMVAVAAAPGLPPR